MSEPEGLAPSSAGGPALSNADVWDARYRERNTPWDLGGAPPILARCLARLGAGAGRRVLVPGAGPGHDAFAFARAGWATTAVDIAPSACTLLRERAQRAGLAVEVVEGDVRALPAAWSGTFDVVWEQTCLCALEPGDRAAYLGEIARVLRPEGRLLALLWNHGQPGGPPYDLPPDLVRSLLAARFEVHALEPVPATGHGRKGEFLVDARPR